MVTVAFKRLYVEALVLPVPVLRIVAPSALVSVPLVTFKMPVPVPPPLPGFVSNSITPLLVNPLATVKVVEELLAPESIRNVPVLVSDRTDWLPLAKVTE